MRLFYALPLLLALVACPGRAQSPALRVLIPLYIHPCDPRYGTCAATPNTAWQRYAAQGGSVDITAIINPASGPDTAASPAYTQYLPYLQNAGFTLVGYVATGGGTRSISDVTTDINRWTTFYAGTVTISGIFFDQVDRAAAPADYYETLCNTASTAFPGGTSFLNPGTEPGSTWQPACEVIVDYENTAASWSPAPSARPRERRAALVHEAFSAATMQSVAQTALASGYGWILVTDEMCNRLSDGSCALPVWNEIPTYWEQEATYIAQLNASVATEPLPGAPRDLVRLSVAPNPSGTPPVITVELSRGARTRVDVLDVLGRPVALVYEGTLGAGATRLPLGDLRAAPGVYLVRVRADVEERLARFVLTREPF